MTINLSPSIMCANLKNLAQEVKALDEAGADSFHIDIMDGKLVPNFALSLDDLSVVRAATDKPLNIHLMVKDPSIYLPYAFKYNAEVIYVHYELGNTENYIKKIKKNGILAGLAVNPNTMISEFNHLLPLIDNLLVMRVHPGGAGRDPVLEVENKIHELTEIKNREFKIALDGAVSPEIIAKWRLKRVEEFILGTASGLFKNKSYTEVIKDIRLRGVYER